MAQLFADNDGSAISSVHLVDFDLDVDAPAQLWQDIDAGRVVAYSVAPTVHTLPGLIQQVYANRLGRNDVWVVYAGGSQLSDASVRGLIDFLLHAARRPPPNPDIYDANAGSVATVVVGIDCEDWKGRTETIQLSCYDRCIVLHRSSGALNAKSLRDLLENRWPGVRCVFTGAELAGDAVDLAFLHTKVSTSASGFAAAVLAAEALDDEADDEQPSLSTPAAVVAPGAASGGTAPGGPLLHGAIDLTPVYSNGSNTLVSDDAEVLTPMGLKVMFNNTFGSEWVKDKKVTTSDWSKAALSPAQIKYCVLDAWVSMMMGVHVLEKLKIVSLRKYTSVNKYCFVIDGENMLKHLFSLRRAPHDVLALMKDVLDQAQALRDAGNRTIGRSPPIWNRGTGQRPCADHGCVRSQP